MCRFESPSFAQLLYDPQGSRLTGHVAVQNFPPVMADDEETVQNSKGQSRHSEEVHGSDCFTMVAMKNMWPGWRKSLILVTPETVVRGIGLAFGCTGHAFHELGVLGEENH